MKEINWQKIWKQRDKSLEALDFILIKKSKIRQVTTLIINDLFDKTNTAKIKVKGNIFWFSIGWTYNEKSEFRINIESHCTLYDLTSLIKDILKELDYNINKSFNQIEELREEFMSGRIR